jgi:hypothetical protein
MIVLLHYAGRVRYKRLVMWWPDGADDGVATGGRSVAWEWTTTTKEATIMSVSPLADLIEECQAVFRNREGVELSYADIANRGGPPLNRSRVQQLARAGFKELPSPDRLRALAKGLGVPDSVVVERALLTAGYSVPRHGVPESVKNGKR